MKTVPKLVNIKKCEGTDCKFKGSCYRYTSKDIGVHQLWLSEVPFKYWSCIQFASISCKKFFDYRNEYIMNKWNKNKGGE